MMIAPKDLKGITREEYYQNGKLMECTLNAENVLATDYGSLIPRYTEEDARRKYNSSLSFYESGALKRISLEEQTIIKTSLGLFPAELITFYESGALKRLFPLNGKITGYWTEENEEALCQMFAFHLPAGEFLAKIVSLYFYESGALRALTLWTGQMITLHTSVGEIPTRIGFSLYESGAIKSLEPAIPMELDTPIGKVLAFNENAIGIHADHNSLSFDEQGNILEVVAAQSNITVVPEDGRAVTIYPAMEPHPMVDDVLVEIPLKLSFEQDTVTIFTGKDSFLFDVPQSNFTITSGRFRETLSKSTKQNE